MAMKRCHNINGLPVDCIANVLSFTSPKDACCMSVVDSTFRLAAESDSVWERFLPSDYREIVSGSINGSLLLEFLSKKDLYFHLSDHPILIDSGFKSFKLEKRSGKKCYMIAAGELVCQGNTYPYRQRIISHLKPWFSEVVPYRIGYRLDIRRRISTKILSFDTNYAAYLVFKFDPRISHVLAEVCVGIKGHEMGKRIVFSRLEWSMNHIIQTQYRWSLLNGLSYLRREFSKWRKDGWMEVELEEFSVKDGKDDLQISLREVNRLPSLTEGLFIQGIEIRPKGCAYQFSNSLKK